MNSRRLELFIAGLYLKAVSRTSRKETVDHRTTSILSVILWAENKTSCQEKVLVCFSYWMPRN